MRTSTFRPFLLSAALVALAAVPLVSLAQVSQPPGRAAQGDAAGTRGAARSVTTPPDFTEIVRRLSPSVVAVATRQQAEALGLPTPEGSPLDRFFGPFSGQRQPRMERRALGSGFFVDREGHIVTNNHVVGNATEIRVLFSDRTSQPAKLVGRDPATDIAVLKLEQTPQQATVAQWGNSDAMQPGAWTIAIGSPFGLGGTVTVGVLSARSRDLHSGPYDDFLQTDASINTGNSGGPLFNDAGEVIGVNSAIFSPSGGNVGIGFAISSNLARNVVDQLIRTGRVERGFIGVTLQEVTPSIAQAMGLDRATGALVASVVPNGPAARAGLRTGDVIVKFDNEAIESTRELARLVANQRPGAQVPVEVKRDGGSQQLTLAVERKEQPAGQASADNEPRPQSTARLGVALAPLTPEDSQRLGLRSGEQGVLVQQVQPGSPAAENGVRPGDVIVSVGNEPVKQPEDVARKWNEAASGDKPALLRIFRDGQYVYVAVGSA